jgi:hypothetical protein
MVIHIYVSDLHLHALAQFIDTYPQEFTDRRQPLTGRPREAGPGDIPVRRSKTEATEEVQSAPYAKLPGGRPHTSISSIANHNPGFSTMSQLVLQRLDVLYAAREMTPEIICQHARCVGGRVIIIQKVQRRGRLAQGPRG